MLAVTTVSARPETVEGAAADSAANLLSLLLSLLLMCAVMVTGSTVSLWTGQRLGHFAVLRALGTSAGRVRAMVVGDVVRLTLPAAAFGLAVGMLPLASFGRRALLEEGLFPASVELPSAASVWGVAVGVVAGVVAIGVLSALGSVVAAGRVGAMDLLKDQSRSMAPRRSVARLVTGLLMAVMFCLPLPLMMAVMDLPSMYRAALAMGLALMLIPTLAVLAPWIVPVLTWPVALLLRLGDRRVGPIAAAGLRAAPLRTTAIAVPVLLSGGVTVALLGAGATVADAVHRQAEQGLRADAVVVADPGRRLPAQPAQTAGVTAVPLIATEVTPPPMSYETASVAGAAWGVPADRLGGTLDPDVRRGSLANLDGDSFAAGVTQADGHHWKVGQKVALTLGDGRERTLELAAVYGRDLAFPEFLLPERTALAHTPEPHADRILLSGAPGRWPVSEGQQVQNRAEYLAGLAPRSAQDDLAGHLIVGVVAGYALLAAANTTALAQRDRRAQRAHLRALGLSRPQLLRCVLYEVLGAAGIGVVLSVVTALVCLAPLALSLGNGPLPAVDVSWTAGVLGAALLTVAVSAALAARPLRTVQRQFAEGRS
ncbi:FtsX-like permease family protein [Streptomyces sp. NPDC101166]|uniref:FtsX-like permease family protein n=1 Tax=Streptomyces sp. NPDC101166 TaxID=3366120 RepID=UPI00382850B0